MPKSHVRTTALTLAILAMIATLAACSASTSSTTDGQTLSEPTVSSMTSAPSAMQLPVPGSTVPADSLALELGNSVGLTVAAIAPESSAAREQLQDFTARYGVALTLISNGSSNPDDPDGLLQLSLSDGARVIVVFGVSQLSALDRVSSSNLGQQFLVIGGQLPEPTENVTAVIWPGADGRVNDGTDISLAPRLGEALRVGLAAVATDSTGIVVALP